MCDMCWAQFIFFIQIFSSYKKSRCPKSVDVSYKKMLLEKREANGKKSSTHISDVTMERVLVVQLPLDKWQNINVNGN